jgi:diguanylate cyclase (GGDEF)-like protein
VPWLALGVSGLGALLVASQLYRLDSAHHEAHLAYVASDRAALLLFSARQAFRPVQHIATVFQFQGGVVSSAGFQFLARTLPMANDPRLLALQWLPRETDAAGEVRFSVRYSYTPQGIAEELDTDTAQQSLLMQAATQRRLVVSPWYLAHGQVRVWAVNAVFATGPGGESTLLGFVAGVYRLDQFFPRAWAGTAPGVVDLWVSDVQAGLPGALRYDGGKVSYTEAIPASLPGIPQRTEGVDLFGSVWRVRVVAAPGQFVPSPWPTGIIAFGGLALGGLLALYLRNLQAREQHVRALVSQRTEALNQRTEELETVYRSAPVGLAVLDRDLRYRHVNERLAEFNGVPVDAHIGKTPREVVPWVADAAEALGRRIITTGEAVQNFEFHSGPDVLLGGERFYNTHWLPLLNDTGRVWGINLVVEETTERRRLETHARHLTEHDALTDLPNRRLLLELLDAALRAAERNRRKIAVLFLDLDHFKIINDTLGHEVGDALLKAVAARLSGRLRRSDLVARLGGDEFTVLFTELSRGEQAGQVAEEIVRTFQHPFHLADQSLYVTTSIGISLYPDDSDTAEGLLRSADLAMYEAKEQGRNTYRFYNPVVDRHARERARIGNDLRQALERDELRVLYQPEVDLRTGRLIGVEALVRWNHPELGLLDPDRFIPVAEDTDLIVFLDDWVLRAACTQARRWLNQGYAPIHVGVNLSAKRFERSDLVESVRRQLAESGLAPALLELELTERTVMRRIDQGIERMQELVALGVGIAIDDFGTGYSSLSYLKRLPVGKLKIDKSFVHDIATDAEDRAIIEAVTALAHTLKKRVIAEGVETAAQRDFLSAIGCDEVQGYLFNEPLPPDQLSKLLAH